MATATPCRAEEAVFPPWAILPDPFPAKKMAGRGVSLIVDGVAIANFLSITSTGGEAERIDVTTHDTPGRYREFRPSFASEMTSTFDVLYDPTHPSHRWLAYLFQTGEVVPIVIQIWNRELDEPGESILFSGFISAFPIPNFPIDGAYTTTVSVTVSGDIAFPGMDEAVDPGPATMAFRGCPGVFMPSEADAPAAADMADITPFPATAWPEGALVTTSDGSDMTWDGTAWVAAPAA